MFSQNTRPAARLSFKYPEPKFPSKTLFRGGGGRRRRRSRGEEEAEKRKVKAARQK